MGKKGRICFAVVLAAVLGGVVWVALQPREPSYQGRPLSSWIAQFHTNSWPLDKKSKTAIQAIGTNANPVLLSIMARQEPAWRIKLTSHLSSAWLKRLHISDSATYKKELDINRDHAANAFMALGEQARPAVPGLIALLDHENHRVRYLSVFALRCLGPVAKDALPRLIKCLDDPDFTIRDDAVMAMGTIHAEPEKVVPKVMEFIGTNGNDTILRRDAVESLGKFGPAAKQSVPLLVTLSTNNDPGIRSSATNALQKIDPTALPSKQEGGK